MANTFRPYSIDEIHAAARKHGIDPVLAEAIYMRESSSGKDPNAMGVRYVRYPKGGGGTYIRGPFQMSDDTARGVIRNNKLGNVDLDDPDAHLDLAMRLIKELKGQYGEDPADIARGYHGGPTGIKNPNVKDELGTSSGGYAQDILRNIATIRGRGGEAAPGDTSFAESSLPAASPLRNEPESPFMHGADAGDMFGIDDDMMAQFSMKGRTPWMDMLAANRIDGGGLGNRVMPNLPPRGDDDFGLGIPEEQGGSYTEAENPTEDIDALIAQWTDEAFKNRVGESGARA